jgi:hypothetical protein
MSTIFFTCPHCLFAAETLSIGIHEAESLCCKSVMQAVVLFNSKDKLSAYRRNYIAFQFGFRRRRGIEPVLAFGKAPTLFDEV